MRKPEQWEIIEAIVILVRFLDDEQVQALINRLDDL